MAYRDHLAEAHVLTTPVDVKHGLRAASLSVGHRPLLASDPIGRPGHRVALNASRRDALAAHWGLDPGDLIDVLGAAMEAPSAPVLVEDGPVLESGQSEPDLMALPIPWHFEEDRGHYISAGIIIAEHGGVRNTSFHRMFVRDGRHLVVRLVPRHLRRMVDEARADGRELPVAIVLGSDPTVLLAAAMSFEFGRDELEVAATLHQRLVGRPLELVRLANGMGVPADAEYAIEAAFTGADDDEGPYVDITGTLDHVRQQPVLRVDAVHHRPDPIFHGILPASPEHLTLMGLPRAPSIKQAVAAVCTCTDVHLSDGGSGWLAGVVAIDPQQPDDGRRAIEAAFAGHPSMKQVTIVNPDIDVTDPVAVEWAVMTRAQPDVDHHVQHDVRGSSLDPTRRPDGTTSKLGIDATLPPGTDMALFRRIP